MDRAAGDRIRELRELQGYTREALAEKVGITGKFLYEVETGRKGCSADVLYSLATALSVTCDYIMTGEKDNSKGNERIICVLETISPKQKSRMHEILNILVKMCDTL